MKGRGTLGFLGTDTHQNKMNKVNLKPNELGRSVSVAKTMNPGFFRTRVWTLAHIGPNKVRGLLPEYVWGCIQAHIYYLQKFS